MSLCVCVILVCQWIKGDGEARRIASQNRGCVCVDMREVKLIFIDMLWFDGNIFSGFSVKNPSFSVHFDRYCLQIFPARASDVLLQFYARYGCRVRRYLRHQNDNKFRKFLQIFFQKCHVDGFLARKIKIQRLRNLPIVFRSCRSILLIVSTVFYNCLSFKEFEKQG